MTALRALSPGRLAASTACLFLSATLAAAQSLTFTPFHSNGIYDIGEKVGWTVTRTANSTDTSVHYRYAIRKNNLEAMKSGVLDWSAGPATVEVVANEPAMIYVEITPDPAPEAGQGPRRIAVGAAVAPQKLGPSTPRPKDFDAFWDAKLRALGEVPIHPVLTPMESGVAGVQLDTVQLDSLNSHVQGYIAKPAREGKFPALVIYQYAGVYALKTSTVTTRAAEGWLALDVDSHDMPPSEATAPRNYQAVGNTDRETSYFLNMYLRDARAIDYIASRPDWDGHTIVIMGTSMGGQQSLVTAGLRPDKITAVLVNEPSGADSNGDLHGRKTGYPNWPSNDPKVMETALYFDTVNFASRIKAPTLAAMGFIDTTAPPVGIWAALNQIPGPKEPVPMVESDHNNRTPEKQGAWESRYREVLSALLHGGDFKPNLSIGAAAAVASASQPVPRTDPGSMLAHKELLEKTKKGVIDIYFEGDSITRRWGATDYPELLANWNRNFHGWNAADFGWGADRIQNILWRLNNGELDGVNPKVIVLLAGTNNVGSKAPATEQETAAEVADITAGLESVVKVMRSKAPDATLIVTAIFPRNDNLAVMPVIDQVNHKLSKLADGKKVRFLNINDKLADGDGRLFEGMMNARDKLHPMEKGYQVWADALKPIFTELLGPPKSDDHAPPPTGVPAVAR